MQNNLAFQKFKHCRRSLDEKTDTSSTLAHTVPISTIMGSKLFLLQRSLARRYWACTSRWPCYHKLAPQVGSLVLLLDLMDFWASLTLGLGIVKYHSYFELKKSIIPFFEHLLFLFWIFFCIYHESSVSSADFIALFFFYIF